MSKMGYKCNKNKCFPPPPPPVCEQLVIQDRSLEVHSTSTPAYGFLPGMPQSETLEVSVQGDLEQPHQAALVQGKLVDVPSELDKTWNKASLIQFEKQTVRKPQSWQLVLTQLSQDLLLSCFLLKYPVSCRWIFLSCLPAPK